MFKSSIISAHFLPLVYSVSFNCGETKTSHSEKDFLNESNHSGRPASPVFISCPPPTKQITTAQSLCLSNVLIKNGYVTTNS